jgi:SNF2 family DNA or RNA helicase
MNWCDSYFTGYGYKTGGLKNPELFKERTKHFIIRHERKDVLPDLPPIQRNFRFSELGDKVEKAYIETFKQFRAEYNSEGCDSFDEQSNILAYLSKMRHLVGLSKIDPCIDFCMEFLGSCDRKITIFVHHKDVGEILIDKLTSILKMLDLNPPLKIIAEMNSQARFNTVNAFTNDPKHRVLIASTLAAGEGLNLQVCSDFIILERQWNPANEEQAEARFPRPGQQAQSINGTYFVAVGTVDEFFAEIVERKREIVHSTLEGRTSEQSWDQSSVIKELAETLANNGGRKWSI